MLPDQADIEIDEALVLDLSGTRARNSRSCSTAARCQRGDGGLGTRAAGGQLVHARPRGHTEPVQLVWHGMRKQLSLFVTPRAHCVLFQQHRLASYLQAGLIVPAQDEALTVRATRSALAKLDVDASRLLS